MPLIQVHFTVSSMPLIPENIVPDFEQRQKLQTGGYCAVVVYDQATQHLHTADKDSNLYNVVKSLCQQVDVDRIYYLAGGNDAFSEDCPLLCATQQFSPVYGSS